MSCSGSPSSTHCCLGQNLADLLDLLGGEFGIHGQRQNLSRQLFSYRETADILGISIGTVMSRVSRSRSALASMLEQNNIYELPLRREREVR